MRKSVTLIVGLVVIFFLTCGYVMAQGKYPERPIQLILPQEPGSYIDIAGRLLGDAMQKYLGQPIILLNKPGAGQFIGGAFVAGSKPDGYTIIACSSSPSHPENLVHFRKASYSSKDLERIAMFSGYITLLCVNGDAPWKSLKEFTDHAKNNPDKVKWGSTAVGNAYWILGSQVEMEAGIKMRNLPFNGEGEIMTALLGNHIDMGILTYGGPIVDQIKIGKIRVIALIYKKRIEELPDVPTIVELGFRHTLEFLYLGTYAPKGTPEDIIAKLSSAIKMATEDAEYKDKMKKLGMPIYYLDTKEFIRYEANQNEEQRRILKARGYL